MDKVPELVLENILSYLKNEVCCQNPRELSVIVSNQYIYDFYKSHFKYKYHDFIDLGEFKKDLLFNSRKAPRNYKFCFNKCNLLTIEEINQLKNIMYSYRKYLRYQNRDLSNFYRDSGPGTPITLNTHSTSKRELDNFIIKMGQLNSNIWFNDNRCCDGCGCDIDIVKGISLNSS